MTTKLWGGRGLQWEKEPMISILAMDLILTSSEWNVYRTPCAIYDQHSQVEVALEIGSDQTVPDKCGL